MRLAAATDLFNKYTHKSAALAHICSNRRPCWRLETCEYCRHRYKPHVTHQIVDKGTLWNLNFFVTISYLQVNGDVYDRLHFILLARGRLHPALFGDGLKFISFAAIGEEGTPHFHILFAWPSSRRKLRKWVVTCARSDATAVDTRVHVKKITDLRRLAGYLLDQNYYPSLRYRPRGRRLITSSKGLLTGRPKYSRPTPWIEEGYR